MIQQNHPMSSQIVDDTQRRIRLLKRRQQMRKHIEQLVAQESWPEALAEAQQIGIPLFEDPATIEQFQKYIEKLSQETQLLTNKLIAIQSEARQKLIVATDTLRQQARRMAFLRADDALEKLDLDFLDRQIKLLDGLKPDEMPEWARIWLSNLKEDQIWLKEKQPQQLDDARQSPAAWNHLVAELPLESSRLACLGNMRQEQSKPVSQTGYTDRFAELVPILERGIVPELQAALTKLENNIHEDPNILSLEKLAYLEILSLWRQRINGLALLQHTLARAERAINSAERVNKRESQITIQERLRKVSDLLIGYLETMPSELFAAAYDRTGNKTIGTKWQETMEKVVTVFLQVQKQLDLEIPQQSANSNQDTRSWLISIWLNRKREKTTTESNQTDSQSTPIPADWHGYLQEKKQEAKKKEEVGAKFYEHYQQLQQVVDNEVTSSEHWFSRNR